MSEGTAFVCIEGLRLILGETEVLRRVHLEARRGELLAVTGPSGSGKTSLLSVLAGFRLPDAGQVTIDGRVLNGLDEPAIAALRRHVIALLSQDFQLLPELDANRNVALPLLLSGVRPREALERARSMLGQVGLEPQASLRAGLLSRGQQQRVALARALVQPRPLLLLDEPTSSLDRAARDEALGLLRQAATEGATVILTTHDPEVAATADRQMALHDGRLVGEAP